jgi:hypothetical protein
MIYFIKSNDGYIKIGFTENNPEQRLRALQTGNPHKLEIIYTMSGTEDDERMLHRIFDSVRVSGEWFQGGPIMEFVLFQAKQEIHMLTSMNDRIIGRFDRFRNRFDEFMDILEAEDSQA